MGTEALMEMNFKHQPNSKYRISTKTLPTQSFVALDEL